MSGCLCFTDKNYMAHDILLFILGLALVIVGGNYVTTGASAIARHFRLTPILIGVTVVAFGSSVPDLVVCMSSTIKGHSELALGDVVGSNIIDILLAIGIVCIVRPVSVDYTSRYFDFPMLALSCLAIFFCGDDILIDHAESNTVSRSDGLMLLSLFTIYMALNIYLNRTSIKSAPGCAISSASPSLAASSSGSPSATSDNIWIASLQVAGSLAMLIVAGNWLVDGASGIAARAGLSEGLIGLTIVSLGSAAPDVATSVIAALRKETGIAIGNLLGACIFNVFFIMGACSLVAPLNVSTITSIDFTVLVAGGIAVWLISAIRGKIGRIAGVFLVALYIAYLIKLILDFTH